VKFYQDWLKNLFFTLTNAAQIHEQIDEDYRETLLKKLLKDIDMIESDHSKELLKQLDNEISKILNNCHLIYKYTKDEDIKSAFNSMFDKYRLYKSTRFDGYIGMKVVEHTDTKYHAIAFNKSDKNECRQHAELLYDHSLAVIEKMNKFSEELLKYIFYSDKK